MAISRPQEPYDIWVDFNDLREGGTVVVHSDVDVAEYAIKPQVGERLVAGDGEGNRCPAVVAAAEGTLITLRLALDRFQAAPFERPAQ